MAKLHEDSLKYNVLAGGGWLLALVGAGVIIFGMFASLPAGATIGTFGIGVLTVIVGIWLVKKADNNILKAFSNLVLLLLDF